MLSYTELRDAVESALRDSANTYFSPTEIDYKITEALRASASYKKHPVKVTYQIESRYGTATSTTANSLVDATKDQFLSTDTGKRVYNDTDKTWADVISYADAETLGLSHNIMASGEKYYIYNKGCWDNKQINIEDVGDYLWVERVEYPIGTRREIDFIRGGILRIGLDIEPDDSDPNDTDRVIDVYVTFAKRHKVSQLTTLSGEVKTAGSKGATSLALKTLQTSGTIEEDQEFTLAYRDQVYTVTADATIATNEATVSFYPALDADVATDIAVTFVKSTLDRQLEMPVIDYAAGSAAIEGGVELIHQGNAAIAVLTTISTAIDNMSLRITQAIADVASGRTETDKGEALITTQAGAVLDKLDDEITKAISDLNTGRDLINTIPKGGAGAPGNYANYAAGEVNTARGYLMEAEGFIKEAQAGEGLSVSYGNLVVRELNAANSYLNQSIGYMRQVNTNLSIAGAWKHYQEWGERKLARAMAELRRMADEPEPASILPRR